MSKTTRTIAIVQPVYLPWLGYFEQIAYADHFVFYDDVQFGRKNWRNRNQILGVNGPAWLTVPVRKTSLGTLINAVEVNNAQPWASKHLKSIRFNYQRAPHFEPCFSVLEAILQQEWTLLRDLDVALTRALCAMLDITPEMSLSSDVPSDPDFVGQRDTSAADPAIARRNMRVVELCLHHRATHFYVGARAEDYIDPEIFADFGIKVWFQDYVHPVYPQQSPQPHSHMAVIDLLMNTGPDAREILLSSPAPGFASTAGAPIQGSG